MPILQYRCPKCGKQFDELVKNYQAEVRCPDCGEHAERAYCGEMFTATGKQSKKCSGNCKSCHGCH